MFGVEGRKLDGNFHLLSILGLQNATPRMQSNGWVTSETRIFTHGV